MICVYKILSIIKPERIYIGSTVNFNYRKYSHLNKLQTNKHHSLKLQHHYNKYGKDDLVFIIIEEFTSVIKEQLLNKEQYYIDSLKPYFNICPTAGSRLGSIASKQTRKKISNQRKGIKQYDATDDTRKKMSLSHIGKSLPKETKEKMRGKRGVYKERRPCSFEYRKHMSVSLKGKNKGKKPSFWTIQNRIESVCLRIFIDEMDEELKNKVA
jgi:group I intron endonuclease